jgi:hypothetical protein
MMILEIAVGVFVGKVAYSVLQGIVASLIQRHDAKARQAELSQFSENMLRLLNQAEGQEQTKP